MSRARTVTVGENIRKEVKHVMKVLKATGYPLLIIRPAQKHRKKEQEEEKPKYTCRICVLCVSGLSEDQRRILRFDIRTAFTTVSTLRQQLTRVKKVDPLPTKAGVVYRVPCICEECIGETQRPLGTHIKNYQSATRMGETEKSAIPEHAWAKQHHPIWDQTSMTEQAKNVDVL